MKKETVLLIGANGQIGTALLPALQNVYGFPNVVAADLHGPAEPTSVFEKLDATRGDALAEIIRKYNITQIYHLAAVLSAKAELDPFKAWNINMNSLLNVLEASKQFGLHKVFVPSSIAVFGPSAPKNNTPQQTYLDPSTVYGISKVTIENWCNYYYHHFGLDVRSLRYPGVISYQSMPGGGTTDYAVDMYHKAIAREAYSCFLKEETMLPMIYIDDVLRATLALMEAPADTLSVRSSYNLAGLSFTPNQLLESILRYFPDFQCTFSPDFRQAIADSWPASVDDRQARNDWGWRPEYDLEKMTEEMFARLSALHHA